MVEKPRREYNKITTKEEEKVEKAESSMGL